ncbi:MAG TPA: hypothetical protein VFO62_00945 [Candidatus Binatia bacterium]|nr:hypothetical protein [Candidatus Binatia bacterium]
MSTTRVSRLPARVARSASELVRPTRVQPSALAPTQSKIGPLPTTNRNIATAPEPAVQQGQAETRTFAQTYFTKVSSTDTQILYNGDRQWAYVTITLETAGPVVVGLVQKLTPVLSGKGTRLTPNEPIRFPVAKGNRVWIASTSVSRVKLVVEPAPWLEQITGLLRHIAGVAISKVTRR